MRNLWWTCWYLWEGLPDALAFPIDSHRTTGTSDSWSLYWELKWPRYLIGTLGFVVVALTLAGCTCCRRQRRPKGFQDDAGNGKEFKDGSGAATETTIERVPSASLELEVPRIPNSESSSSGKVQFEALPVERLVGEVRAAKPKPPSPSPFSEDPRAPENGHFSRRDWFAGNSHVPRERLKYLREIGRGWFGKVVEGTAEIPDNPEKKNRGVVVRILTEEATSSEKTWFLGEATPYLKLSHPNVLTLLGSCLETDPYLLLFESCPAGDLKGFLRANRDKGTCEALRKENVPTRMALDIANALEHMHENGFAHTDLSARNCLVAPDLSAKLGDYGTGVEKYPGDYYVVGDRALPIRWSAPESLNCTETTIETRTITPRANLWSFAVFLWEIATWGERPFDELGDEQVIEMIFSLKTSFLAQRTCEILVKRLREEFEAPRTFREAVEASWKFLPEDRATLAESKEILAGKRIEDFEKRWENLRPNAGNDGKERDRSASLQDLRGSVDDEIWDEKHPIQAKFRLGPEEPVKNHAGPENSGLQESGSETEEESWRGRVERGAYTEKVKQKSKSVADLMVLVHIDSDSDADLSLGPQISEKTTKKRLPPSGSDGDLRSHNFDDEFDEAIRKLRDNSVVNGANARTTKNQGENSQFVDGIDKPKLMTLTHQGQTPILRLCFGTPENTTFQEEDTKNRNSKADSRNNCTADFSAGGKIAEGLDGVFGKEKSREDRFGRDISKGGRKIGSETKIEGPVLRLLSKGDPQLPVLRFVPEANSAPPETLNVEESSRFDSFLVFETPETDVTGFPNNFEASSSHENSRAPGDDSLDVELWNNALAHELEKKNPGFEAHEKIFDESIDFSRENAKESLKKSASAPNTPKSVNFRLEENARKDFPASAPETPRKHDLQRKIEDKICDDENRCENDCESRIGNESPKNLAQKSTSTSGTPKEPEATETRLKNAPRSPSLPETAEKRLVHSQIQETSEKNYSDSRIEVRSSRNENEPLNSSSASGIPEKPSEIHEKSGKNVTQYSDSFSAPETPENRDFQPETSSYYRNLPRDSSSAPETPGKHYFASRSSENMSENGNAPSCSSSAPETPEKRYFLPEIEETSSKSSYYQDLPLGSSSAPETPGNHYFASKTEESISKTLDYYPDSLGSTSAPETPQFRGSYVTGNADEDSSASEKILRGSETPQSRGNYSVGNGDEDSSTGEDLDNPERIIKRSSHEVEDEEDRKHLSTPDDERSSDSGFRDKESCEEEESPVPCPSASSIISGAGISSSGLAANSSPLSASAEEEQMRILFELDTILDAEYYGTFRGSEKLEDSEIFSANDLPSRGIEGDVVSAKNRSISESLESTESTEIVDTVRANSCEPDFLDSRALREIASLKREEDGEKAGAEEIDKSADFFKRDAEECDNLLGGHGDDTEADFLADSASESLKNLEDLGGNIGKDSADLSAINDSKSWDSTAENRRSNVDSLSDGKIDKSNESNDLTGEFRSSDASDFGKSKITDSDSGSPIRSEKIGGDDFLSAEERRKIGQSEDFSGPENSENNFGIKNENRDKDSDIFEASIERENSTSDSPIKSERNSRSSDIFEALGELENSASNSSLKSEKTNKTSEICELSVEFENSVSNSSLKSEKCPETPEKGKASPKFEQPLKTSEKSEFSTDFENSSLNFSLKSSKSSSTSPKKIPSPQKTSELLEISSESITASSASPKKIPSPQKTSELLEISSESVPTSSASPKKIPSPQKTSELLEISSESVPTSSASPKKIPSPQKTSELLEISSESVPTSSASPKKIPSPQKTSELLEISSESVPTSSASPKKIPSPQKTSELPEISSESVPTSSASPKKIPSPQKSSELLEISSESVPASSASPKKIPSPQKTSELPEISSESITASSASPQKMPEPLEPSELCEASETDVENSPSDSPLKTERNQTSDLSMETRGPESVNSDVEQWSSRENINENDNEDEDSSTMSLRSDNSYVSFGLDEEFVAAIRNELREKLPRAQMPVIEALDPRDEKETSSINKDAESKRWEEEEAEENAERGSGGVDIAIRYNIYGTPLSPILEERESAGTSESLVSKEDSRDDASIASRVSEDVLSEDVLVVDTRTNKAMILEANSTGNGQQTEPNSQLDDDRDTSHGDFDSDEENLEYPHNHLNRGSESKRICMGSGGAPLPSPEEETKWQQQFPLPLQMQDDLMSTSFGTDRDWDSQDEDEGEEGEDGDEDEEENSSSSGEFVWKRYDESHGDLENVATRSPPNKPKSHEPEVDLEEEEEEGDEDEDEEEEEFTPSAWDATLAPHRSALRSPEKSLKSGDQKKSVWFKKQRYHCVYEYPKETPVAEGQGQAATTWEPTSYADWEEMMDEPRLDVYPMEYDESNRAGDEEFYVSSSNRPFQFQSGEGKYVSQFFPGASSTLLQQQQQQPQQQQQQVAVPMTAAFEESSQESQDEVDRVEAPSSPHLPQPNGNARVPEIPEVHQQQTQLGELRHTRDRLKLNLLSTSGSSKSDEDPPENRAPEVPENPQKSVESISENRAPEVPENSQKSVELISENRAPEVPENPQKSVELISENRGPEVPENSQKSVELISENRAPEIPENSQKSLASISVNRDKNADSEKSLDPENAENRENSEKTSEKEEPANLAVKNAPEVAIDEENAPTAAQPIFTDNCKGSERKKEDASSGDDLTVIQAGDEVLGAIDCSRSIGDEKKSTSESSRENIVDIPKLETEESPEGANELGDENRREATTPKEISPLRDGKTERNVHSSKS